MRPLADLRILRPSETARALKLLTDMDLLRLKTIARLHARGLPPDVGWEDLLQEAITRVLTGARQPPENVPLVAFLAGIMRSLKSEHWRRLARKGAPGREPLPLPRAAGSRSPAPREAAPDPERSVLAQEQLHAIQRLFAADKVVLGIITALGEGLSADEICQSLRLTRTDYDSARKRLRRCLLREGLTCEPR
jgi:DNA-directed RNA polymerase specialized sigma24 family protein